MSWLDDLVIRGGVKRYIAFQGEMEFLQAAETDHAGRTVKLRVVPSPEMQGKANPFSQFIRRRRGQGGSRFETSFAEIGNNKTMMLETLLLNWGSTPQGDFVVLLLNQESEHHPFMGCRRPSRDAAGTRWMVVAIQVDDTQQLIDQEKQERLEHAVRTGRRQTLSNVARIFTKSARFWDFLREHDSSEVDWNTEQADRWLKETLGISSKADLDEETPESIPKIAAFHRIRAKYLEWQEERGFDTTEQGP